MWRIRKKDTAVINYDPREEDEMKKKHSHHFYVNEVFRVLNDSEIIIVIVKCDECGHEAFGVATRIEER